MRRAKRVCPRCNKATYGDCCKRERKKRLYDYKWEKASRAFLQANPLCAHCLKQGVTTPATVTDHIIPHRNVDIELFWDEDNWQSLCHGCHNKKTAAGQ